MGLFGGSKSKSSTSQSQTGSQTQLGDPTSVHISSGKKSNNTVNIVRTDFNAVNRAFSLADKTLGSNERLLKSQLGSVGKIVNKSNRFAMDTIAASERVSKEIIAAGQYSAGATERIAGAFEAFVDEQNNPDNKNTTLLIVGAVGVLVLLVTVKK